MKELLLELQPHLVEIISSISIIITILAKSKKSKSEKLKQKKEKAHEESMRCEKNLAAAYEKEKELTEEVKKYETK